MRRIRPFPSPFAKRAFRPRSDVRGGHAPERMPTDDGIRVDFDRASGVLGDHSRDGGPGRCEEQRGRPLKVLKSVEVVEGLSERSRIWQPKPSERAGLQGIRPRVPGTFGEVEAEIGVRRAMEVPRALRDIRGSGRSAEVVWDIGAMNALFAQGDGKGLIRRIPAPKGRVAWTLRWARCRWLHECRSCSPLLQHASAEGSLGAREPRS